MKIEVKKQWIKALKSGDYKQCKLQLKSGNKFCCLGVLCDLVDNTKWHMEGGDECYDSGYMYPPKSVHEATGLPIGMEITLSTLNDEGSTFEEIADYIKEKL